MPSHDPQTGPLRHTDFLPHQGKPFRFGDWDGTLRLASVSTEYPVGWPSHLRPPFTLIFHGPTEPILPEGTYVAEVEGGSQFTFHIMPIHTADPQRQEYQAVFN